MSSKRPSRRMHHLDETVHLNITPFIDVLVCLILYLLTSAAVLKLSVVDTQLPKLTDVATLVSQQEKENDQVVVSLQIRDNGFVVGRVGEDRSAERQRQWQEGGGMRAAIGKSATGKFDYDALNRQMRKIKGAYPKAVSVLILPDETISYEVIVEVMDASRDAPTENGKRELLFPDAVIGHLAEPKSGGA